MGVPSLRRGRLVWLGLPRKDHIIVRLGQIMPRHEACTWQGSKCGRPVVGSEVQVVQASDGAGEQMGWEEQVEREGPGKAGVQACTTDRLQGSGGGTRAGRVRYERLGRGRRGEHLRPRKAVQDRGRLENE